MLSGRRSNTAAPRTTLNPGELLLICTDDVYSYLALEAVQRAWEAHPELTLEMRAVVLEQMILAGKAKDKDASALARL